MKKTDPKQGDQGEKVIPDDLVALIQQRDGAAKLLKVLPQRFSCADVANTTLRLGPGSAHNVWECCGCTYLANGRVHEAIAVFQGLYDHLLTYQEQTGKRAHKASPLVFLSDCYLRMNCPVVARHFLMLTLCEDAIQNKGVLRPETTGVYFRAVWQFGLSDGQVREYTSSSWTLFKKNRKAGSFPEWLLQELDQGASRKGIQEWTTGYPSPAETTVYNVNRHYVNWLLKGMGDSGGKTLERLAHYLVSAIPGCRARMGMRSQSTEYDVLGFLEGHFVDFRADLGRYILCECKDWKQKANFTAIAKFSRVLESTKANCGIIFSSEGITGEGSTRYAERELLKLFQDHGIAILVVRLRDLHEVASGRDFIEILRTKYESVRLDLNPPAKRPIAKKK